MREGRFFLTRKMVLSEQAEPAVLFNKNGSSDQTPSILVQDLEHLFRFIF